MVNIEEFAQQATDTDIRTFMLNDEKEKQRLQFVKAPAGNADQIFGRKYDTENFPQSLSLIALSKNGILTILDHKILGFAEQSDIPEEYRSILSTYYRDEAMDFVFSSYYGSLDIRHIRDSNKDLFHIAHKAYIYGWDKVSWKDDGFTAERFKFTDSDFIAYFCGVTDLLDKATSLLKDREYYWKKHKFTRQFAEKIVKHPDILFEKWEVRLIDSIKEYPDASHLEVSFSPADGLSPNIPGEPVLLSPKMILEKTYCQDPFDIRRTSETDPQTKTKGNYTFYPSDIVRIICNGEEIYKKEDR